MRLIDADALMENCDIMEGDITVGRRSYVHFYEIEEAPTVDAIEVVRCKDCKHYGFTDNRVPEEQVWWCYKWSREKKENDFCSYGEKKHEID